MHRFFRRSSALAFALALAFVGNAVIAPAQSDNLDKHSRKIYHKLSKHRQGSYLHLVLSDATDAYGALGPLSEATFAFTSAESNSSVTYRYADVENVNTEAQPIGHGTEPRRHIRHLVPIVITAAAIGTGAGIYLNER